MAFGVKYRLEVATIDGINCRVDILEDNYVGAIIPLQGSSPEKALRMIKGTRNANKTSIIIPTTLEFTVKATTDFEFSALAEIQEQTLRVEYYEANNLQFVGWLLPDEYQEAYIEPPYDVTFTATDYLPQLKDVPFVSTLLNTQYDQRSLLMFFIKEALLKTGLQLNIKENINIYDVAMTSAAGDSPLTQGTIDPAIFYPDNRAIDTYTALEFMIKNFRARVYQENATWYIEQINEKQASSYIERTYDSAGNFISQTTVSNNHVKLTRPDVSEVRRIKRSAPYIDNDRPFRDVSVYYRQTNVQGADVLRGFSNESDWINTTTLQDWTPTGTTVLQQTVSFLGNPLGVRINGAASSFATIGWIESEPVAIVAGADSRVTLRFFSRFNSTVITTKRGRARVQIRLVAPTTTYYWRGGRWAFGEGALGYREDATFGFFQPSEIVTDVIPESGNLFIRFYQIQELGIGIGNVQSITLTGFQLEVFTEAVQQTAWLVNRAFINQKVTFTTEKEVIIWADGPGPASPGTMEVGSTATTAWARRGVTESRSIQQIFLQLTANLFQKNAWRFSGDLLIRGGRTLKFGNTFSDQDSVSTRRYYLGFYEWIPAISELSYEGIQYIAGDASINFETFTSNEIERNRFDIDAGITIPIFPGLIPEIPTFDIPNLSGDVIGVIGGNEATKQIISGKEDLNLTGVDSSRVFVNATVIDDEDVGLEKTTALKLFDAWPDKQIPDADDQIVVIDSVDGELKKTLAIANNKTVAYLVKNQTGGTLLKGKVARAVGVLGASGRILIDYAIADGTHLPKFTMGLIYEDIPNGEDGYVIDFGQLRNVDTDAFNEGDVLWLSDTVAGGLTATRPQSPDYKVLVALVIRKSVANGILQVRLDVGKFLTDLHDVENDGNEGDVLTKDNGVYKFLPPTGGGGGDTVQGDLDRGIQVTSPSAGVKVVNQKFKNVFLPFTPVMQWELFEGHTYIFTATSDFELANPTNILTYNGPVEIIVTQGLGGNHRISTVGDRVIFAGGVNPTLTGTFGQSDWLRGRVANGFLLIYAIEKLSAPGIDIEPPPPPPIPLTSYLALFSMFDLTGALADVGNYSRSQDNVAEDLFIEQGVLSQVRLREHLKLSSPISAWAGYRVNGQFWRDQSGNAGANAVISGAANLTIVYKGNRFAGINKAGGSSGALVLTSNQFGAKDALTFSFVVDIKNALNDQFIRLSPTNVLLQIGFTTASSGLLRLIARRVSANAGAIIDDTVPHPIGKFILQVVLNYSAGTMHFYKNNTLIGTTALASSGTTAAGAQILELVQNFGTNNITLHHFSLLPTADLTQAANERAYLDQLYGGLISPPVKTGQDVYELFDVILSPDRYNYSPYAANVRRSSDNAELVVSHSDLTGLFDSAAFSTHVGAGNGFAANMRNQQNPSRAFSQTTAARQPQIIKNAFGSRAALQFSNSARRSFQLAAVDSVFDRFALHYYYFCTLEIGGNISGQTVIWRQVEQGVNTIAGLILNRVGSNNFIEIYGQRTAVAPSFATGTTNLPTGNKYLVTVYFDYQNGIGICRLNGVVEINNTTSFTGGSSTQNPGIFIIGNAIDNHAIAFNGIIGGVYFRQGQMATAQLEAIENQIMSEFGI